MTRIREEEEDKPLHKPKLSTSFKLLVSMAAEIGIPNFLG